MRLPSFQNILSKTIDVLKKYPLEIVTAVTGTCAAIQLTYNNSDSWEPFFVKILMIASLALPSYLAITIRSRFRGFSTQRKLIEQGIITAALLLFLLSIQDPIRTKDIMRFFLLNAVAHLMVSCAGFVKRGSVHAFWQFNKHLFLRICTSVIFSGVLFIGLAGALGATDVLFSFHVKGEWYMRLFMFIAGIFNTIFFLSNIPEDPQALEEEQEYPKVLKVFTQFVLVPLVIIYLLILLAYEAKIIVEWRLPQGWVSNLIMAYGIVGILSILLVYPIRSMQGNNWIKAFTRWFYALLIPLVILMFVAIGKRIGAYGLTEERIFVLVLAIWLGSISIYYLLKPNSDIRLIPLSLALIAVLLSLSVFQIAQASQRNRLKNLLVKNGLLVNGKTVKVKEGQKISFVDRKNISSAVNYLLEFHDKESLEPWFVTDSFSNAKYSAWENSQTALNALGIKYVDGYVREDDSVTTTTQSWFSYTTNTRSIPTKGYDELYILDYYGMSNVNDTGIYIQRNGEQSFKVLQNRVQIAPEVYPRLLLEKLISKYGSENPNGESISINELNQIVEGEKCTVSVYYKQLAGSRDTAANRGNLNYEGVVLIKWK